MDSLLGSFPLEVIADSIDYITVLTVSGVQSLVRDSINLPYSFKIIYVLGPLLYGNGVIAPTGITVNSLAANEIITGSVSFISTQYSNIILSSASFDLSRSGDRVFTYSNIKFDGFSGATPFRGAKYMLFGQK